MAISIHCNLPARAHNAGLFISRGVGIHPTRIIQSYELLFLDSGTLSLWEEEDHYDVAAGETLLLVPGRRHGGASDYPPDLRFYWIHFDLEDEQHSDGRSRGVSLPRHSRIHRADRLTELFRMFLDDQESGGLSQRKADLLLCLMLTEIADPHYGETAVPSMSIADKTRRYIKTHFHESISTRTISQAVIINPDYLERIYKRAYNQTITQSIHHFRIRYAKRLLLDEVHNIDQVSEQCGYADPGYFRRIFKRQVGMTPKAFRKLHSHVHVNTG